MAEPSKALGSIRFDSFDLFLSDEAMIEFTRRAGGPKTHEDHNIFEMMIRRSFGEITLELIGGQNEQLKQPNRVKPKRPSTSVREVRDDERRKIGSPRYRPTLAEIIVLCSELTPSLPRRCCDTPRYCLPK